MQQEVHIKMLACFLHQMWLSSCFCLLNCLHLLFSCQNSLPDWDLFLVSFPLVADDDTALHLGGWPPAACSKPNLDSHFTDCAFFFFFARFFLSQQKPERCWKKAWEWHHLELDTLKWTNPSLILFAEIDFPPCLLVYVLEKGETLLSNIKDAIRLCHDKQYQCSLSFYPPLSSSLSYAAPPVFFSCTVFLLIQLSVSALTEKTKKYKKDLYQFSNTGTLFRNKRKQTKKIKTAEW